MSPKSTKRYFLTLLITLSLTSFSLAGDIQCPNTPPPPPPDEEGLVITINEGTSDKGNFQFMSDFWEFFAQNIDLYNS